MWSSSVITCSATKATSCLAIQSHMYSALGLALAANALRSTGAWLEGEGREADNSPYSAQLACKSICILVQDLDPIFQRTNCAESKTTSMPIHSTAVRDVAQSIAILAAC